jgi:hypothetical protein
LIEVVHSLSLLAEAGGATSALNAQVTHRIADETPLSLLEKCERATQEGQDVVKNVGAHPIDPLVYKGEQPTVVHEQEPAAR